MKTTYAISSTNEKMRFLKKSFGIAGFSFLLVCFIGFIVSIYIDSSGLLKNALNSTRRFDFQLYKQISNSTEIAKLARVSLFGFVLILASAILNIVWAFRVLKASKIFIYTVMSIYILSQGIGFGLLFVTWKAKDLLAIFGISGGIFLLMASIGYMSKNLMPLGKWLFIGSMAAVLLMIVVFILNFTGVYNDRFMTIIWAFVGLLTIGWIAFDIWSLKRTAEFAQAMGGFDVATEFRLTMWFGFRLLSNMIALIWTVARFYSRR